MSPWDKLLERPPSGGHFVQLYEADKRSLADNVARYLWEGLRRGEGAIIIVTSEHRELFSTRLADLGADVPAVLASRQLVILEAQATMAEFIVNGQPDWHRFETTVRHAMRQVVPAENAEGLRAFGEMVGVLWKARQFAAAIRLEQLWNRLLEQSSFSLYCAYAIDIFGEACNVASLDGVLCTHTHLVPAQTDGSLEVALNKSLDEILGADADRLRLLIKSKNRSGWAVMPTAEKMILTLREHLPEKVDEIVARARQHYEFLLPARA